MNEWRPIDTAPSNKEVLVFRWTRHIMDDIPNVITAFYISEWRSSETRDVIHPTHWMPLPNPPEGT